VWENPSSTLPPLSAPDAIEAARKEVAKYVQDPERWHLESITLESLGDENKWVYTVRWHERGAYGDDTLPIPVLMNGQAVIGVWEKEP
jgi:hypothetical protein